MTDISDRYRRLAQGFTTRVEQVPAADPRWEAPSPCPDWTARGVVGHLVDVHHMFFALIEHEVPAAPPVDDGPLQAWTATRDAMAAALDDPAVAGKEYDGFFGRTRWDEAVDRFVNFDVLIHTW